jgi:ACS family tartrate transporter-like MFS transporter
MKSQLPNAGTITVEARAMKKISTRILPLVFLLYIIAFLDRANVAYAKLTMSSDLGFSEAAYGLGAGLFFAGYFVLEIPGALIVQRWGARLWMSRIMITWGLCTMAVGMVHTAHQFYVTRFLLGVAEAGFMPGIIVYLNQWFPSHYRGRALARYLMASPLALAIGGPIAGFILRLHWLGLSGWRWVFILEGVPAILAGIAVLFVMTDRPEKAKWLEPEERAWILNELQEEKRRKAAYGSYTVWQALRHPVVVLLVALTFMSNIGIQGFFLWLPTTVQRASGLPAYLSSAISGVPFVAAVVGQQLFGWSSDRTRERIWHTSIPLILAAVIFPITTHSGMSFGWLLFWLCASSFVIYGFGPPYWTLPTLTLGEAAAAAGVGLINAFGGLGGFVGPTVVGSILTVGYSFTVDVFFLSACFLAAGLLTIALRSHVSPRLEPAETAIVETAVS